MLMSPNTDAAIDASMEIRATTPQVHCDVKRILIVGTAPATTTPPHPAQVVIAVTSLHGVRYSQEGGGGIQE